MAVARGPVVLAPVLVRPALRALACRGGAAAPLRAAVVDAAGIRRRRLAGRGAVSDGRRDATAAARPAVDLRVPRIERADLRAASGAQGRVVPQSRRHEPGGGVGGAPLLSTAVFPGPDADFTRRRAVPLHLPARVGFRASDSTRSTSRCQNRTSPGPARWSTGSPNATVCSRSRLTGGSCGRTCITHRGRCSGRRRPSTRTPWRCRTTSPYKGRRRSCTSPGASTWWSGRRHPERRDARR